MTRRRGGPFTATTKLQLAVFCFASVAVQPTVVLPMGNCVGWLQVTATGADPPAASGKVMGTVTGRPSIELVSILAGQASESTGVGAGAGESPQAALNNRSNTTSPLRRTKSPEPATRVSAANEPPERSGARGPRERRRKGVRGTKSPGLVTT